MTRPPTRLDAPRMLVVFTLAAVIVAIATIAYIAYRVRRRAVSSTRETRLMEWRLRPVQWESAGPGAYVALVESRRWRVVLASSPSSYSLFVDDTLIETLTEWPAYWTRPVSTSVARSMPPAARPNVIASRPRSTDKVFIFPADVDGTLVRYHSGTENDPAAPWGKNTLTMNANGNVQLEMRRNGTLTRWQATIDRNGFEHFTRVLRAADFPNVLVASERSKQSPVAVATFATLQIEVDGQSDSVTFGANDIDEAYGPVFDALDTLLFQASAGTIQSRTDKFPTVIRDARVTE